MYRPDAAFPFDDRYRYGIHFFETDAVAAPGESVQVNVWVRTSAAELVAKVKVGTTFVIYEGSTPVADATVIAILRITE
jgi:hypothetical protein